MYLTVDDGTDRSSRNIGNKIPFYAAWNPKRTEISFTQRRKAEFTHPRDFSHYQHHCENLNSWLFKVKSSYTRRLRCGPGRVVSIATSYGLDGPGIECRWGASFSAPVQTGPGFPPSLLYNGYRVFPGVKERPGRDVNPSPPSSAIGHERVELYLYSPCGSYGLYRASVPVQWCTLPCFTFYWLR